MGCFAIANSCSAVCLVPMFSSGIVDISAGHQSLSGLLSLFFQVVSFNMSRLVPHISDEQDTNHKRHGQQYDVHGNGVVVESVMGESVETLSREVEETGKTDDETVDFAEGSETEDFGGVVGDSGVV